MPSDSRLLLPVREAAERLSLSEARLRRMLADGAVVGIRPGGPRGDLYVAVSELERYCRDATEQERERRFRDEEALADILDGKRARWTRPGGQDAPAKRTARRG